MNNPTDKSGPTELTHDLSELGIVERDAERLRALRSMLAATEARQSKMKRVRHQTLAAGLTVRIRTGSKEGASGIILDADYIHSKVQVELHEGQIKTWLNFSDVSPVADADEEGYDPLQSD